MSDRWVEKNRRFALKLWSSAVGRLVARLIEIGNTGRIEETELCQVQMKILLITCCKNIANFSLIFKEY